MSTATEINSSDALSHATPKADGLIQRASSKRLAGKLGRNSSTSTSMQMSKACFFRSRRGFHFSTMEDQSS